MALEAELSDAKSQVGKLRVEVARLQEALQEKEVEKEGENPCVRTGELNMWLV